MWPAISPEYGTSQNSYKQYAKSWGFLHTKAVDPKILFNDFAMRPTSFYPELVLPQNH